MGLDTTIRAFESKGKKAFSNVLYDASKAGFQVCSLPTAARYRAEKPSSKLFWGGKWIDGKSLVFRATTRGGNDVVGYLHMASPLKVNPLPHRYDAIDESHPYFTLNKKEVDEILSNDAITNSEGIQLITIFDADERFYGEPKMCSPEEVLNHPHAQAMMGNADLLAQYLIARREVIGDEPMQFIPSFNHIMGYKTPSFVGKPQGFGNCYAVPLFLGDLTYGFGAGGNLGQARILGVRGAAVREPAFTEELKGVGSAATTIIKE